MLGTHQHVASPAPPNSPIGPIRPSGPRQSMSHRDRLSSPSGASRHRGAHQRPTARFPPLLPDRCRLVAVRPEDPACSPSPELTMLTTTDPAADPTRLPAGVAVDAVLPRPAAPVWLRAPQLLPAHRALRLSLGLRAPPLLRRALRRLDTPATPG